MSIFSDILGDAKTAVTSGIGGGITSAAQSLASGDLSGAANSLAGIPESIVNGIGNTGGVTPGDSFRGINARGDAAQNWCWYCILPALGSATPAISMPNPFGGSLGVSPSTTLPWYYVQKASLPLRTFERDTLSRRGHKAHYAESYSLGDLQLEFFMDSKNKSMKYLKQWQSLVVGDADPTRISNQGIFGLPAKYKKQINLVVMSVNKKTLLNVTYLGCWPVDAQALDLASGSSDVISIPVTFAVEDVKVSVMNDQGFIENLADTARGYALGALSGVSRAALSSFIKPAIGV